MTPPILITTCDPYLPVLKTSLALYEKYWKDTPIHVVGFKVPDYPLPERVTFHSIGDFKDYPVQRFGHQLLEAVSLMGDTFVYMLDDYWLLREVDKTALTLCNDVALYTPNVLRVDLTTDCLFSEGPRYPQDIPHYGCIGHVDLIKRNPEMSYLMSVMPAIWRKDNFLRVLRDGMTHDHLAGNQWSPWQIELHGTPFVRDFCSDLIVLGTRQWPVKITLGRRGGDAHTQTNDLNGGLSPQDMQWLKEGGLL